MNIKNNSVFDWQSKQIKISTIILIFLILVFIMVIATIPGALDIYLIRQTDEWTPDTLVQPGHNYILTGTFNDMYYVNTKPGYSMLISEQASSVFFKRCNHVSGEPVTYFGQFQFTSPSLINGFVIKREIC